MSLSGVDTNLVVNV